jgi:NAD(P)-dependent dehydrogenase (short-subunit alcohol dehydrogenase family)
LKTVLITGASSGIGLATSQLFAAQGWTVVASMRKPECGKALATLENVFLTRLDVQDPVSIESAVEQALRRVKKIDVLVNNAGFGQYGLFEAIPREKIQEQFEVNVFGVMDVTRALLPHFRANHSGVVVNLSAGAGLSGVPLRSIYCASKFALEGFSEALAYELASQGIRVKLVEPSGDVSATHFGARAAASHATDPALRGYEPFERKTARVLGRMASARAQSADDVAQVVFEAATDGSDRLRYLAGEDVRSLRSYFESD